MKRPECDVREFSLRDGTPIRMRPIRPDDKAVLAEGLKRLSETSRYRRFLSPVKALGEDDLRYLTELDYDDHFAWIAFALDRPDCPGVAVARYIRDPADPKVAEPAVAVADAYQGRGLGSLMLESLTETAVAHGVEHFRASLLAENESMRHMLEKAGARFEPEGAGVLCAEVDLPGTERDRAALVYGMIRHACEAGIVRAYRVLSSPVLGLLSLADRATRGDS